MASFRRIFVKWDFHNRIASEFIDIDLLIHKSLLGIGAGIGATIANWIFVQRKISMASFRRIFEKWDFYDRIGSELTNLELRDSRECLGWLLDVLWSVRRLFIKMSYLRFSRHFFLYVKIDFALVLELQTSPEAETCFKRCRIKFCVFKRKQ